MKFQFEILKDSEGSKKEVIISHIYWDKFINLMMSHILLQVKAVVSCVYWILGVQCWYASSTLIIPVSRAAVISKIIASGLEITGSTWNSGFPWKWWIVRAQAGSLYEKVWNRMHEKRERTCPVYQKVPFVPPFFAEREKSPQNIVRNPRTRLLLPLVRTLHLSCRRRGRFVPLPEAVFQYGRKSKYDWTTGFTILSFTRHAS